MSGSSVAVTAVLGQSPGGKIVAALVIAAFVCLVEWLLVFAPKRWTFARIALDRRSQLEGVWTQNVTKIASQSGVVDDNSFAVFWIEYQSGDYRVRGHAFDSAGHEVARWDSLGSPTFDADGRSMRYEWQGELLDEPQPTADIERTGVTGIDIDADLTTGRGRVDHVGMNRTLLFTIERVTAEMLTQCGLAGLAPNGLTSSKHRNAFAREYSRLLSRVVET